VGFVANLTYSENPKFQSNRFTPGRLIAERVNKVKTRHKVNPILYEARPPIASRRLIKGIIGICNHSDNRDGSHSDLCFGVTFSEHAVQNYNEFSVDIFLDFNMLKSVQ